MPTKKKLTGTLAPIVLFAILLALQPSVSSAYQDQGATSLLEEATQVMLDLKSFHFEISTPVGKTMLIDEVELEGIEGDVLRPASFQATFTIGLPFFSLGLDAIGQDDQLWVSDPLSGGDSFVLVASSDEFEGQIPPELILNPDRLVIQAVSLMQDATVVGEDDIDGILTTRIDGTFDPADLNLDESTPGSESPFSGLDPVQVSIWLDDELRVVRAEFAGALLPTDDPDTEVVRRIDLSAFNDPVEVELPDSTE